MVTLQQNSSSMEETVRTLLQNQDSVEGPRVDPLDLMKAYKDKLLEEMWKQQDSLEGPTFTAEQTDTSLEAGGGPEETSKDNNPLLERLRALEAENSALSTENDNQRKQYERCLDEVANQVVQALLTQKNLKEECVKLRTRVFDLEQQNRILSLLFQQRVKLSAVPVSQEVQRNGKAGFPAGQWPSLLSLTCPRSSGSGSQLSLSSAGSEHSSGSHTWADGRGFSKQCASNRDKRLSTGSVSSNHSASVEQADLGWKEGHVLKGLKRLQMNRSKKASSQASVSHCKDCMTSNEGIYSPGVRSCQQAAAAKQEEATGEGFRADPGTETLDSDDPDDESSKGLNRESSDPPIKDQLYLDTLDLNKDEDRNLPDSVSLSADSGLFPSPDSENFLFLESPMLKPGVSPTDSLTHLEETDKNSLGKLKASGFRFSDRNNNQERSTDRKSRLDYNKGQGRFSLKQIEAEANDVSSSVQHSATRALSCMNEARHRSSSAEVPHCRDQAKGSRDDVVSESPQKKPKPQFCDSARKAFILRSKSADGGQEQLKHTHYLLHQKLITGQKPKLQPNPSPSGHSAPRKRTNLSNSHASSRTTLSTTERSPDLTVSTGSRSLENVHQLSPVAPSMKQSTVLQSPVTKVPTSDSVEESLYDHLPCSPQKQRRQDHHCDVSQMELRPPSPPRPPGRTTSLLLRSSSESSASQTHSSTTGTKTNDLCSVLETQKSSVMRDHQHTAPQRSAEDKPITSGPKVPSVPVQGAPESEQLSADRRATNDNQVPFILSSQSVLQRSQQSVSEPKLSEVLPAAFPNVYYLGISNNPQTSCSNAVKRTLPANAKSHEVITGQDTSTFLLFGRQNKDNGRSLQTFQTFTCDPQVIHECGAHDKAHRIETRCNSLDSDPVHPGSSDGSGVLDWGFDEQGWLFKRSVSVSTRPLLKPVMGMNGAKARSQSFGARYMDRPSFNRSGKVRTQIKTHSGSSLNSLGDVLPGSMSCSSSYHCPMNRSLLNNFLIEEGLTAPSHLGSSSERLQSLKFQREQARRLQIEQQFSSAFGEPVSEEPERQSTITTIEEKVMLGIEENLHKSQEQDRTSEVKQKSGSSLASWFGFRKSKLPASSSRKTDPPKVKEEKREQKITSLLGGKNTKSDKKRDRRKSDGKESSVGRRESHDAVRACISMPCPGMSMSEIQGHAHVVGEPKMQMMKRRADDEDGPTVKSPVPDTVIGSSCKMRTLDSGIGTIPLPESCSFFSSILHLLPKSSSTPEHALSPPSVPGSSSEDRSPSPLPRWRIPSSFKDTGRAGVPSSLSDSSMTHIPSVPFPTVAFLQPIQPSSEPIMTSAGVCETLSGRPRPLKGGMEPKKLNHIKSKPRATPSQEQTRLQLANCKRLQTFTCSQNFSSESEAE